MKSVGKILCLGSGYEEYLECFSLPRYLRGATINGSNLIDDKHIAFELTGMTFEKFSSLSPIDLQNYDAILLFGLDTPISASQMSGWIAQLQAFVQGGGGIYIYAVSVARAVSEAADYLPSINQLLGSLVPGAGPAISINPNVADDFTGEDPEMFGPLTTKRWSQSAAFCYALASKSSSERGIIAPPPCDVTEGVANYWFPVRRRKDIRWIHEIIVKFNGSDVAFTSASEITVGSLKLQPLVLGAADTSGARRPVILSWTYGGGRVVLNAGESTISFFNWHFSGYSDRYFGVTELETVGPGTSPIPSDGLSLFVGCLAWAAQISAGTPLPAAAPHLCKTAYEPAPALVWSWAETPPDALSQYRGGVFAGLPPPPNNVEADIQTYLGPFLLQLSPKASYLVAVLDYEAMIAAHGSSAADVWSAFCAAVGSQAIEVVPALRTRDAAGNAFVVVGTKSWPNPGNVEATRVTQHLRYWQGSGMTLRAAVGFSASGTPHWFYRSISGFALRTYDGIQLIDPPPPTPEDNVPPYRMLQQTGYRMRPIVFSQGLGLTGVQYPPELTWIRAESSVGEKLSANFFEPHFSPGFVSSGPKIDLRAIGPEMSSAQNLVGKSYVAGRERWRLWIQASTPAVVQRPPPLHEPRLHLPEDPPPSLAPVTIDVHLTSIEIFDGDRRIMVFHPGASNFAQAVDLLHDRDRTLTARVTDARGRTAVSGVVTSTNDSMSAPFLSDRNNIAGGVALVDPPEAMEADYPPQRPSAVMSLNASALEKVGAPVWGDLLVGIDGEGLESAVQAHVWFQARGGGSIAEDRMPVHAIVREHESSSLVRIRCDSLLRLPSGNNDGRGGNPYVALEPTQLTGEVTHWYFRSDRRLPRAMMADVTAKVHGSSVALPPDSTGMGICYLNTTLGDWRLRSGVIVTQAQAPARWYLTPGVAAERTIGSDLQAGDYVAFPAAAEALYVLSGQIRFNIQLKSVDDEIMPLVCTLDIGAPGTVTSATSSATLLIVRFPASVASEQANADYTYATEYRSAFGLGPGSGGGSAPPDLGYAVQAVQGAVSRYGPFVLQLQASNHGFAGKIDTTRAATPQELPQRLPVCVAGLNPLWTAGVLLENGPREWYPLGVDADGRGYTTLPRSGEHHVYIGNLVSATDSSGVADPDLRVVFLPAHTGLDASGNPLTKPQLSIHNPTQRSKTRVFRRLSTYWPVSSIADQITATVRPGTTVIPWEDSVSHHHDPPHGHGLLTIPD